jgi:catechol 2,3-dioxygenase-like lactoylglutathione lyase family enzyme
MESTMATTSTETTPLKRPVERYELGMHHLAQPTMDPRATLKFYVDTMGAKITHCVSSRGWRPNHYDYIHMFLNLGKGDNIAMFYYFGVEDPKDIPKYGSHHSFGANSLEELAAWADWLEANGYPVKMRNTYEVFSSIYVWDPNGRWFEIAANHRELNDIDAEDAELTAQALVVAADERAKSITRMWEIKAGLVEEREGPVDGPALLFPTIEEYAWIPQAAGDTLARTYERGVFTVAEGKGQLRLDKPEELPEALWWTVGTGGIKGTISSFDETELTIG